MSTPVAWQERQKRNTGTWVSWYPCEARDINAPREAILCGGIPYQWRPLYAECTQTPLSDEQIGLIEHAAQQLDYYARFTMTPGTPMQTAAAEAVKRLQLCARVASLIEETRSSLAEQPQFNAEQSDLYKEGWQAAVSHFTFKKPLDREIEAMNAKVRGLVAQVQSLEEVLFAIRDRINEVY
jgi:hypothetical protein